MKRCLFVLVVMLISIASREQNYDVLQVDKLNKALANAKDDTTKALSLTQLAEAYRDRIYDSSFYYAQHALELSRQIKYPAGESKSLLALSYYFYNRGDMTKALELGLKALDIARRNDLWYDQSFAMIRLGNVYMLMQDYKEALNYFHQTRKLTENTRDSFFYAVTFWRAAAAYKNLNMNDSTLLYAKKAEDTARGMGNNFIQFGISSILGYAYAKSGNDSMALRYLRLRPGGYFSLYLAEFFKDRGLPDSALIYANLAYQSSLKNGARYLELESATLLASLYETSDPKTAVKFLKIVVATKDSLYGTEKVLAAKSVAFAEKERQAELLDAEAAIRNRIKIVATFSGLILAFVIASMLFISYRKARNANALLQIQKNEIAQALTELKKTQTQLVQSEKMASLGELTAGIAHEIQNPLNFVNNFSEINTELTNDIMEAASRNDLDEVKAIATDIRNNQMKINDHGKKADSIVKNMLQHSRSSSSVKEPTDLNKLAEEYLRLSFHGLRAKDKQFNATINTRFDPNLPLIPVSAQDIGRVLLNLYNNAFYAVHEKSKTAGPDYQPTVTVETSFKIPNGIVSVTDNGTGVPDNIKDKIFQPFFTTKPTGQGTGLGLSLSYDMVTAHGGNLRMESNSGQGTSMSILLPFK